MNRSATEQNSDESSARLYRPATGVLFSAVGAEGVLLSTRKGDYFGLDEVGVAIWTAMSNGSTLSMIRDSLLTIYDVDASRLESDIDALVADLASAGLIEPADS